MDLADPACPGPAQHLISLPRSPLPWALLPMRVKLQQEVFRLDPKETFLIARNPWDGEWKLPGRQGDHSGCLHECASLGEKAETGERLWRLCTLVVGTGGGGLGWERPPLCPTGGKSIQRPGSCRELLSSLVQKC
ncbi:hypothetical protein J1605_022385 [Eschrichtius robustus]|uniref:Uncharacterized protein n=1 Tax=Eschrichtius robustus TaxID=9764 RepID=A0AB34HBG6_ESCRO|nr:hypothetical protein J1605_022385 [Eschrichtius robustus]